MILPNRHAILFHDIHFEASQNIFAELALDVRIRYSGTYNNHILLCGITMYSVATRSIS